MFRLVLVIFLLKYSTCEYFYKDEYIFLPRQDESLGYSVELQYGRVIIGAPAFQSRFTKISNQDGRVYCWDFAKNLFEVMLMGETPEETGSNAGLGTTIVAEAKENGFVLACAPRWGTSKQQSTQGKCYYLNDTSSRQLYPLKDIPLVKYSEYYSQFGQAGFSAHLIEGESMSVILGAPGVLGWTGTVAVYDNLSPDNSDSAMVNANRADKKIADNSYFGYSVSSGRFNASNPNQVFFVAGAPRNNELYGSVNIFELDKTAPFKNRYMFKGTQFGEYFGASLSVGDINNDQIDDIIIGAPTYSQSNEENIGSIYISLSIPDPSVLKFHPLQKISGEEAGSKFGTAISYLGDINRDGFGDVAIGAPFDNTYNRGAVYIYFGSETGLQPIYKQRILASEVHDHLRGFGFSLSRGLDVDDNTNNDLAIGAYLSSYVVLFKSRPVVKIRTEMTLDPNSQLNIQTKNLTINYCVNYTFDQRLNPYYINLIFNTYKVKFINGLNEWTTMIKMNRNGVSCDKLVVFIDTLITHSITVYMDYNISKTNLHEKFIPMEEQHFPSTLPISFNKGCATNICKPDLKLKAYLQAFDYNELIIGSTSEYNLNILVENLGDISYTNKLEIQTEPNNLKFSQVPNFCDKKICNFKYPILSNEKKNLVFKLDATKLKLNDKKLSLNITLNNKIETFDFPLKTDVNLNILAKSKPEEINNLFGSEKLSHEYNIENTGLTSLKYLKFNFLVPVEVKQSKILTFNIRGCSRINIVEEISETFENNNGLIVENLVDNTLFINCTNLDNNDVKCVKIECDLENDNVVLDMIINGTLLDGFQNEGPIVLTTTLEADLEEMKNYTYAWTILTRKQQTANFALYLGIGILIAVILVAILLFTLYKCGFFKKKELPNQYETVELISAADT